MVCFFFSLIVLVHINSWATMHTWNFISFCTVIESTILMELTSSIMAMAMWKNDEERSGAIYRTLQSFAHCSCCIHFFHCTLCQRRKWIKQNVVCCIRFLHWISIDDGICLLFLSFFFQSWYLHIRTFRMISILM